MILVVAEQRKGTLHRASWEALAAAQELAAGQSPASPASIEALVLGIGVSGRGVGLSQAAVRAVHAAEHPALDPYTPDGYVLALEQAIAQLNPEQVFLPHTYQTRDFAPKLAARLDRALITDCVGVKRSDGRASFYRPVFQGS